VGEAWFTEIEHTADLAIEVRGADRAELFARAGCALFAVMVERDEVLAREERSIEVSAANREELLHAWLSELLELFGCEGFMARDIVVTSIDDTHVAATLRGECFERGRHHYIREVKAVTFHDLRVTNADGEWRARVTFDV
jgi:SHS2 domain-containing protein